MAKRLYPAVLERGDKGTFAVWLPDFPDCVAAGRSREEALEKAEQLLAEAVDAMAERDLRLPEPTALERIASAKSSKFLAFLLLGVEPPDPSERVNIYLPRRLLARADARAAELGMSRSSFFGFALSVAFGLGTTGVELAALGRPRSAAKVVTAPQPQPRQSKTKPRAR